MIEPDFEVSEPPVISDFPWPPRADASVTEFFVTTCRQVLTEPTSFFRRMPHDVSLGWAVAFFVVCGVIAAGLDLFWGMTVGASLSERLLPAAFSADGGPALTDFLISPLAALAALLLSAILLHVFLMLVGGARAGFGVTLRVAAFLGAAQLLAIIPLIGTELGMIVGNLVLSIIGLREAHQISTRRAALAVFLPLLLIMILGTLLALLVLAIPLPGV